MAMLTKKELYEPTDQNFLNDLAGSIFLDMGLGYLVKNPQTEESKKFLEQLEQARKTANTTFQAWLDFANKVLKNQDLSNKLFDSDLAILSTQNNSENRQELFKQFLNGTLQVQDKYTKLQFRFSDEPTTLIGITAGWIKYVSLISAIYLEDKPVQNGTEVETMDIDRQQFILMDEIIRAFDALLAKNQ